MKKTTAFRRERKREKEREGERKREKETVGKGPREFKAGYEAKNCGECRGRWI